MLEESKVSKRRGDSSDSSMEPARNRNNLNYRDAYSPVRPHQRLDSPCDTFKDVFEEYGAKLSPSLMRLQLENNEFPEDEDREKLAPTLASKDEQDETTEDVKEEESNSDDEEQAFLANQRKHQRKASSSGQAS